MKRVRIERLLSGGSKAIVQAGAYREEVPCKLTLAPDPVLELPVECLERLQLEPNQVVNVAVHEHGKRIDIGPLIGVLLNRRGLRRLRKGDARYHEIMAEARRAGACLCFFTLNAIDPGTGTVDGWVEWGCGWANLRTPLPDVIYNRATYRNRQVRGAAQAMLRDLVEQHGVILLNGVNSFGKRDVSEALTFFADTASLSPQTLPFTDPTVIEQMLQQHGKIFVKADHSSHGSNVLRVEASAGGWQVQGHFRGAPVNESFQSLEQLQTFLMLLCGKRRWVVQKAVDLLKVQDRIFDIRTIVQKNGDGEWTVPLVLVRWAQPNQVVTNTSQGAEPILPAALRAVAGRSLAVLNQLEAKATSAALQTVAALEARFGRLGEVGVDIGLDSEGKTWVLEANTKPFHRFYEELPVPLAHYPIQFAVHLAAQKWAGRQSG